MATVENKILASEETAKTTVRLGELANDLPSSFCFGGSLKQQIVRINYKLENGDLSDIALPGADEKDLSQLLAASSVASFGKGTEDVVDLSYRDAFKFDPDMLSTSFELSNTAILSDIETLLVPNRSIRAEFHKLNIYTGPNGHFKPHLDTPRSAEMFGSLVVCLPTRFTGGSLVTRHLGQEVIFDWSSSFQGSAADSQNIQWAAFFCDVEHEILPVTSGHRITLTYNLYYAEERPSTFPVVSPFYRYLQEALKQSHFMPEGGCLGFDCKHSYVFSTLNDEQLLPSVLKGADYMIFQVAKTLGLNVTIKPAVEGWEHWYLLPEFPKIFGKSYALGFDPDDFHYPTLSMLESTQVSKEPPQQVFRGITWCRPKVTWQEVLDLVSVPVETDATMLERQMKQSIYDMLQWEYVHIFDYELKAAGACKQDIPAIMEALSKLQPKYRRVYRPIGAITYWGNEPTNDIRMCYQSAVILMDVPCLRSGSRNMTQLNTAPWSVSTRLSETVFWNKATTSSYY